MALCRFTTVPLVSRNKRALNKIQNTLLYYPDLNGAQVGDLFISLIHTFRSCGAHSFDFMVELQRHVRELATPPGGTDAVKSSRHSGAHCRSIKKAIWPKEIGDGQAAGSILISP